MELIFGLLFNAIWIIGSVSTAYFLFSVFRFIPLVPWLESGIIVALSLVSGLMWMATFIRKSMGDSWRECWTEAGEIVFSAIVIPVVATCLVAVFAQWILSPHIKDEELQQWAVCFIAGVFWCFVMGRGIKHSEDKLKNRNHP